MRRSRELKRWVSCVLVLTLLYQVAPAAFFSSVGKLLLAYLMIQTLFLMLADAREEPHDHPRAILPVPPEPARHLDAFDRASESSTGQPYTANTAAASAAPSAAAPVQQAVP